MRSTRLPGKVLKKVLGQPLLAHIVRRLRRSKEIDQIILATTTNKEDDALERFSKSIRVPCFRGDEQDVLRRYYDAATLFNANPIVRITGDCPLIDWTIIDEAIRYYKNGGYAYVNSHPFLAEGLDFEIFSYRALQEAFQKATRHSDREHVTPYIKNDPAVFKIGQVPCKKDYSHIRVTVDEPRDLALVRKIFPLLQRKKLSFTFDDIITLFKNRAELLNINAGIIRNEGYLISLENEKRNSLRPR